MEKVRLGIIGAGNMGSGHIGNYKKGLLPEIEITAVADRRQERREWARGELGEGVAIFSEGSELIASGLVDAILIAVPHYQHPGLAMEGFRHGLHVMCEKPAGVYTKQVREMNAAADACDRVFGMMFNQRTNCVYRKIKEMIDGGELGSIKRVNWIITDWYRTQYYYDSGAWRATWDGEGGGVLLNQCPHQLDLIQWLCGMPCRVRAFLHEGKWHDIEVEDDVTAYLEYPNGATGVFITTTGDAPGTNRLEISGDLGKVVCENDEITFFKNKVSDRAFSESATEGFAKPECERIQVETDGRNLQHVEVLCRFAGAILRGEALVADGREGMNGLTLSNAMHLSSWLDKTVDLPFDEDLYLELLNQRRATSRAKEDRGVTLNTEGSY